MKMRIFSFLLVIIFCSFSSVNAQSGNIIISSDVTSLGTWGPLTSGAYTFTPNSSSDAVLNVSEIYDRLLGNGFTAANVIVSTSGSITVNSTISIATSVIGRTITISPSGNLLINAAINSNGSALALNAGGDINTTASLNSSVVTGAGGALTINATGLISMDLNSSINTSGSTSGGNISITGNNGITINASITSTGTSKGNLTISTGVSTVNTPFDAQIAGVISVGNLTKSGSGRLNLSADNTYTGTTTISTGSLNISNAKSFGSTSSITVSGSAQLQIQGGISVNIPLTLSSTNTSGALRSLSGNNIWANTITLNGSNPEIACDLNTLTLSNANSISSAGISLLLSGVGDINVNGIISLGAGTLTKDGTGTLLLSGVNVYTGSTTINAGTIKLGTGNNIPDASAISFISSSSAIDLNGTSETIFGITSATNIGSIINSNPATGPITLTIGANNGTGTTYCTIDDGAATLNLVKIGTGTITLRGASTYKGVTNINAGTLYIRNANALGSTSSGTVVASGATLQLNAANVVGETLSLNGVGSASLGALYNSTGTSTWSGDITLTGATTINNAGTSAFTISGSISGQFALSKIGTGEIVLTQANTYTGLTSITAGTLTIQNASALGDNSNGTNVTGGVLQLANNISVSTEALTLGASGALTNFSGTNTWGTQITLTGAASINSNGGTLNLTAATVISGSGLALTFGGTNTSGIINVSGAISLGTGSLTMSGSGTLNLNNANTYSGLTSITNGILNTSNNNVFGTTTRITVSGTGSLQIQGGITSSIPLTLSSTNANGALRSINGNNTWTGAISISGTGPEIACDLNTLTLSNTATITGTNINMTLSGSGDIVVNGIISTGTGTITKAGTGVLTYNAVNTYTGLTTVTVGTLKMGVTTSVPVSNAISISTGATLDLNGFSTTFGSLAGAGTVTSASAGSGTLLLTISGSSNSTFSGVIQNGSVSTLNLVKSGSGILTLSGANTYTGSTSINGGAIYVQNAAALGAVDATGTTVASGAELQIANNITLAAEPIKINGAGIGQSAGAIHSISGTNSITGVITMATASTLLSDAGTLTFNATNAITGAYNLTIAGAGGIVISGTITIDLGGLTKNGAGTLTLSGANTYKGLTTVNSGTLFVNNNAGLGTTDAGTIVSNAAMLQLSGVTITGEPLTIIGNGVSSAGALSNVTTASVWVGDIILAGATSIGSTVSLTINGVISGSFSLTKVGNGSITLSGANTYTGLTTVSTGTLIISNNAGLGSNAAGTTVTSGASLQLNGVVISGEPLTLNGVGAGSVGALSNITTASSWIGDIVLASAASIGASATLTINGIISGGFALTKVGTSTVELNAINTYSGSTTISAGTLKLLVATAIPINSDVIINNGGSLDLNGFNTTIGSLAGTGTGFVTSSATGGTIIFTVSGSTSTSFAGVIQNGSASSISLVKAGSSVLTLIGANTYSGATSINAGAINAQNATALGAVDAVGTTVANGAELQVSGSIIIGAEPVTISGAGIGQANGAIHNISGTNTLGGVITMGSGSTILSDAGSLTLNNATNAVSGNYNLVIGGIGSIQIQGKINIGSNNLTKIDAGTSTLSAVNNFTGLTTISAGILKFGVTTAIPITNDVVINSGASLDLNGISATLDIITGPGKVTSSQTTAISLTLSSVTDYTFNGVIENGTSSALSLIKLGTNTLTLTGANTYTGSTTITAGVIKLGASQVIANTSNLVFNGGEFNTNGFTETLGTISVLNNSVLTLDPTVVYSLTFSNIGTMTAGKTLSIYGWQGANIDLALTSNGKYTTAAVGVYFVKPTGAQQVNSISGGLSKYGQVVTPSPNSTGIKCSIIINTTVTDASLTTFKYYFYDSNGSEIIKNGATQLADKSIISL